MENRYYIRICKMCGDVFESTTSNTMYCCEECRDKAKEISAQMRNERKKELALKRKYEKMKKHRCVGCDDFHDYAKRQVAETVELFARIDPDILLREIRGAVSA